MTIGINCGHTAKGPGYGAVGVIKESEHTRLVGRLLMDLFCAAGVKVADCTIDEANTQGEYLSAVVALANRQDLDWFVSIHFNASNGHNGQGVEVYTYEGRQYQDAISVCENISALGFKNRGVKSGSGLYVVRKTKAKSMLIEVCFCDNQEDAARYISIGHNKIAEAIFYAVWGSMEKTAILDDGTAIMGRNIGNADRMNKLLLSMNPEAVRYIHLAEIFLEEGEKEGVRGDGAFCQALIETGYFRFNGDVRPEQHNYAGLGATGGVTGLSFVDDRTGVRAQIQHLKAYASTKPLCQACVDPRYRYVNKGCAPTFEQLSGKWAVPGYSGYPTLEKARVVKDSYGDHIVRLLQKVEGTETDVPAFDEVSEADKILPEGYLYVVQVGAYKNLSGAEKLKDKLEKMGITCIIKKYH